MLQLRNLEMWQRIVRMLDLCDHKSSIIIHNQSCTNGMFREDCMPGTCFSGACMGFPDDYSLDGKCGKQNGNKLCGGKWGSCCNSQGQCGNGTAFCAENECQSGSCETSFQTPWSLNGSSPSTNPSIPSLGKVSPDGSCGGANEYVCNGSPFGDCCSNSGYCGSTTAHCVYLFSFLKMIILNSEKTGTAGCRKDFGTCTITNVSPDGSCK
jgi:hypothetical protein